MKSRHIPQLLLILSFLLACSSSGGIFVPKEGTALTTVYKHGRSTLKSEQKTKILLTLLEQRAKQALYQIEILNSSNKEILFTPTNIKINLISTEEGAEAVKIFYFEELIAKGDSAFAWDGATIIAGSATSVISGGGAIASAAGRLIGLGISASKKAHTNKKLNVSDIKNSYLRRHTLSAGSRYSGVIKIELPQPPKNEDLLQVLIDTGIDTHSFEYLFNKTT